MILSSAFPRPFHHRVLTCCSLAEALAYCAYRGSGARIMSEPEYVRTLDADTAGRCGPLTAASCHADSLEILHHEASSIGWRHRSYCQVVASSFFFTSAESWLASRLRPLVHVHFCHMPVSLASCRDCLQRQQTPGKPATPLIAGCDNCGTAAGSGPPVCSGPCPALRRCLSTQSTAQVPAACGTMMQESVNARCPCRRWRV